LKTREPSCVPRAGKPFFIPVVHRPPRVEGHMTTPELPLRKAEPRAMEHVTASELPSQERRAWSPGTRGSAGAHLSKEARSRATKHVAAPELTSARRRGSELRNTWWRRSSPQQGGEVWGHGTHGGSGAHFYREVWFEATTYVAARGYASCSLS
jgi:hypothetical protein